MDFNPYSESESVDTSTLVERQRETLGGQQVDPTQSPDYKAHIAGRNTLSTIRKQLEAKKELQDIPDILMID
jgi:hypothetical protein